MNPTSPSLGMSNSMKRGRHVILVQEPINFAVTPALVGGRNLKKKERRRGGTEEKSLISKPIVNGQGETTRVGGGGRMGVKRRGEDPSL